MELESGKKCRRRPLAWLLMLLVFMIYGIGYGAGIDESHATGTLTIKAGFYGGPYYDVETYSYGEMSGMAGDVYIYSGVDSGGFMRICYARGVPIATLVDSAGIDIDSVKYFHMGTADGYGESFTTFSAASLMGSRNFYPHMVDLIDPNGRTQQTIDFSQVTEEITAGAMAVPTMIAVESSEFSRKNAYNAGVHGYDTSSMGNTDYRLMFGQSGLGSVGAANNVQTSDQWVREINIQLSGTPNIVVEKKLISGNDGEIGSKYSVKIKVSLPDSYSYLSQEALRGLENQILENLKLDYDKAVIKVTKKANGEYEVEIIGKGDTDLKFNYSRKEYDGGLTFTSGQTYISGSGQGSGGGTDPTDPSGSGGGNTDPTTPSGGGSTDPTTPTQPTQPTQPPTQPTQPPTQPTQPPTQPTDPTDPSNPSEPTQPTQPTQPPTQVPTQVPTQAPTQAPTAPATQPTDAPYIGIQDKTDGDSGGEESPASKEKSAAKADIPEAPDVAALNEEMLTADAADADWMAADNISVSANEAIKTEEEDNLLGVGIGSVFLFIAGFATTALSFYRKI